VTNSGAVTVFFIASHCLRAPGRRLDQFVTGRLGRFGCSDPFIEAVGGHADSLGNIDY